MSGSTVNPNLKITAGAYPPQKYNHTVTVTERSSFRYDFSLIWSIPTPLYDEKVPQVSTFATPPAISQPVAFLDFLRQFSAIRSEVMQAIEAVCASQRFVLGPEVERFEHAAATACGAPHAIGCASGTDALWLALAAAGIGDSAEATPRPEQDAVITSPFSFFASASSILRAGARPLFADIDPLTFNLAPAAVEAVLRQDALSAEPRVRAILPVHLYGQCADWDEFTRLQQQHPGLRLIEDAAQAFGATWAGIPAGGLGDAAAFSFYPTKNLSAFGDAGMLTTRSAEIDERARSLRAHGMKRRYFHEEVGWNSRLDTLQAAVLEVKLRYIEQWTRQRRALAANYHELFLAAGIAVAPSPEAPKSIADGVVLPWTHARARITY